MQVVYKNVEKSKPKYGSLQRSPKSYMQKRASWVHPKETRDKRLLLTCTIIFDPFKISFIPLNPN